MEKGLHEEDSIVWNLVVRVWLDPHIPSQNFIRLDLF